MNRNIEKKRILGSRVSIIILVNILMFVLLLCRLYYLQVFEAGKYKTMSDENRISTRFLLYFPVNHRLWWQKIQRMIMQKALKAHPARQKI